MEPNVEDLTNHNKLEEESSTGSSKNSQIDDGLFLPSAEDWQESS